MMWGCNTNIHIIHRHSGNTVQQCRNVVQLRTAAPMTPRHVWQPLESTQQPPVPTETKTRLVAVGKHPAAACLPSYILQWSNLERPCEALVGVARCHRSSHGGTGGCPEGGVIETGSIMTPPSAPAGGRALARLALQLLAMQGVPAACGGFRRHTLGAEWFFHRVKEHITLS